MTHHAPDRVLPRLGRPPDIPPKNNVTPAPTRVNVETKPKPQESIPFGAVPPPSLSMGRGNCCALAATATGPARPWPRRTIGGAA
jgi:hypothetical protein